MTIRAAWALIAVGIVLVLANWYTKPEAALAWTAALAMFAVMIAALRLSRPIVRRTTTTEAMAARGLDQITTSVVFAAVMVGVPLTLTLARSYRLIDGSDDLDRRSTGLLIGALLVMVGNTIPKNLPPLSSGCDGARQQTFHRLAGWTWVLCGLASALGWLALPIDIAETAAIALPVAAIALTIVHLVRLARRVRTIPPSDWTNQTRV
jgi:hypothetical protein